MRVNLPDTEHLALLVQYCLANDALVENFNRIHGCNVGQNLSPICQMVDEATGKTGTDLMEFVAFVKDAVWDRLPRECFEVMA